MARILNKNGLIAVLDIGTSKTCCLLARPTGGDKALIVGAGYHQNKGVKKAEIIDISEAVDSVRHAVDYAENLAEERIETVVATACSSTFKSFITQGSLSLNGSEVTQSDINRLTLKVQDKIERTDDEILHCIPIDYSVDSRHAIPDPRGLTGEKLYLALHSVMAPPYPIRDMNSVLEQSHLSASKIIASPYAAGMACLTTEEMQQGSIVVDLGAGSTGIGVFYEGQLVFTAQIPTGGDQITKDLSARFKMSMENAERLKTLKGSCLPSLTYDREEVEIPLIGEDERVNAYKTPRINVINAIIPRIEEIFENIKDITTEKGFFDICLNVVLTGGAGQLHGICEKASSVLGRNVRLGRPERLYDKNGIIPEHAYSSYMNCIGILHYTSHILLNMSVHQQDRHQSRSKIVRIFRWFLDNS